jgi:predicted dehydrogenase
MSRRLSRRRFLGHAAGLSAAAALAGRVPAAHRSPPGERVNVAVVGVGDQGTYNLIEVHRAGANIVALCDVAAERAEVVAARKVHPQAKFFQDFRGVLDLPGVDAVLVATPDHMHAIPAVAAMRAGKHVYCEKPLAHSVHEVRVMRAAAAKGRLVTQMGTQIHAGDNYRRVVEIVRAGVLGPVSRVHVWCAKRPDVRKLARPPVPPPAGLAYDLWLGPAPEQPYDAAFVPFHWRWFWDFGGGILADMACHFMDLPHWALGLRTPARVAAEGKKTSAGDQNVPDVLRADYHYPARGDQPEVHLTWYSGCVGPDLAAKEPFHGFASGVLFEGPKAQLVADYGRYKLLPESQFKDFTPPKQTIPPSVGHHREWLEAIKGRGTTTCNFDYSGALAETVLLGNVAFRCGRPFAWDESAGKADAPEAAAYLRREYRKGWKLEE